ncbi:unnamed protein product [Rangifer tarandus platyrhynchus]|uniref:Uncharacterized protein n=1 Tax=Rangifer tarandus platyrhynchus TaxID=3082113 RepID=A0AC59YGS7_RANTA
MRSAAKGAGRTGHAAPSPDPARAGGRGRPRGGPAGGRPAGSSPRRPASIKPSARQPARPGARGGGGARTPLPPGSRVPEGKRDPPESRGGPGPGRGRTPHPPRHGGRAAGTPSRNEALPGAFKSSKPHPIGLEEPKMPAQCVWSYFSRSSGQRKPDLWKDAHPPPLSILSPPPTPATSARRT